MNREVNEIARSLRRQFPNGSAGVFNWDEVFANAVLQHLASQRQEQECGCATGEHDDTCPPWCEVRQLRAQAAAQGAQDEIHWKTRRSLLVGIEQRDALVARLGEIANDLIARLREAGSMHRNGGFVGDNIDRWLNNVELFSVPAAKKLLTEIPPTTPTP